MELVHTGRFMAAWLMTAIRSRIDLRSERGATAVEYGLIVALIAVAVMVTVGALGLKMNGIFCSVLTKVGGSSGSC